MLDGGSGADQMTGGAGDDQYYVDDAGDKAIEALDSGTDSVQSTIGFILPANVENLELVGSGNMDGQGNGLNNTLTGNAWNNNLDGGAGADTMIGDEGDDTYTVDNIGDQVQETPGAGLDTVRSTINYTLGIGVENLILLGTAGLSGTGNELDNNIIGNAGANKILGGFGLDTLTGGGEADIFIWTSTSQTGSASWSADIITDFQYLNGDRIDLTRIDGDIGVAGRQSFSFIDTGPFTAPGQMRYSPEGGSTNILLNTDSNLTTSEAVIKVEGTMTANSGWFLV
jgi:Ca2+-binding RTX toxin-like protein